MKLFTMTAAILSTVFLSCSPNNNQQKSSYVQSRSVESSSKIFGGEVQDLSFQQKNGIVGLIIVSQNALGYQSESICTGTLIDPQVVVTAAHCVSDSYDSYVTHVIALFVPDMMSITDLNLSIEKKEVIYANKISVHSEYLKDLNAESDIKSIWNDIALIKLSTTAPSDFSIAKLATKDFALDNQSKLVLSGFGIATPIVRQEAKDPATGNTTVVDVREESESSGILRSIDNISIVSIDDKNLEIILDQTNSSGACHGDSGGPAFVKSEDGSLTQVGITSRGTNELGNCNEQAIYTGIIGQLDWIHSEMAKLTAPKAQKPKQEQQEIITP